MVPQFAMLVDLVLVGVKDIDLRIRLDRLGYFVQRFGREFVVIVQHRQVVAGRKLRGPVGRDCDPLVPLQPDDFDSRIGSPIAL